MTDIDDIRSDIKEIRGATTQVARDVAHLVGRFDALLPHLATKADLAEQVSQCRKSLAPRSPMSRNRQIKIASAIGGALAAFSATLYALREAIASILGN